MKHPWQSRVWQLIRPIVLASLALVTIWSLGGSMADTARALQVQPQLLQLAKEQPTTTVQVIVQRRLDSTVETSLARLHGRVTKDLHIINAFAAEMPAAAVPQLAQLDGVRWISSDDAMRQSDDTSNSTTVATVWASALGDAATPTFAHADAIADSAAGPNGTYATGANAKLAYTGLVVEVTPDHRIARFEIALRAYVPAPLDSTSNPRLTLYDGVTPIITGQMPASYFNEHVGAANAQTFYIDITRMLNVRMLTTNWKYSSFNGLQVVLDQTGFASDQVIAYDAIGFRITSVPGSDNSGVASGDQQSTTGLDVSKLQNVYNKVVRATDVWNQNSKYLQGQGMTVAVVDSGINTNMDLDGRLRGNINFNSAYHDSADRYGHGTFVADMVAANGTQSSGARIGIAPKSFLLNVRVSDDQGMATESDTVSALQWIYDHRQTYNIRVVNLSLNAATRQSYNTSPLDAAVEILWFNKIVVVASAGNNGEAALYPPANDPFVITVGATDDRGTVSMNDDIVASYSAYGTTTDGVAKPDLVAPGTNIVAYLPENDLLTSGKQHPANRVDNNYFRMSGTSMSAPIVTGAVALLLQDEPNLTPDQVKYRLTATAMHNTAQWPGYSAAKAGAGYLDIYATINGTTSANANSGITPSHLLTTGDSPMNSDAWNSANWGSANWGSANWGSANWGSANWGSDYWGQ